ncbi:MAG: sugar phosphate isomerase/epimerase family protein [Candidatus Eremiobacterota bacterium]
MKNIKNRTGLQNCKHNNLLLEEEIIFSINHDFKVFEILFDGFWPWDIKRNLREKIKKFSRENNIILQVHAPIERAEPCEEILRETLIFTIETGSNLLTVHPRKQDINIYKNIFSMAKEHGIFIGLENYKESETFHSPSDIINILSHFSDYSNTGLTFDTGHANIYGNPVNYLKSLPEQIKILNVHLHDNLGEKDNHMTMGEGNINFHSVLRCLEERNYTGNFIIEHWHNNLVSAEYLFTVMQ